MTETLEFSKQEYKMIMIYMLRTLMDKVDGIQEQMDNVSREMEILGIPERNVRNQKHNKAKEWL